MISAADVTVTVLAPAFYTDPEWSTRYLRISAQRHEVPVRWYGVGEPYRGWPQVQIHSLLDELRKVRTSHVLYTDSSDAMFLCGLDEIARKYVDVLGNPELLMSVEADGLNAGGWMAQTDCAIDSLVWVRDWQHDDNPQERWRAAVANGELVVEQDLEGFVFQVVGSGYNEPVTVVGPHQHLRLRNKPGVKPCVAHFAGGYSDPKVGKAALIEPVWRELGYASTVEVEL